MPEHTFDHIIPYAEHTEAFLPLRRRDRPTALDSIGKSYEACDIWWSPATNTAPGRQKTSRFLGRWDHHATDSPSSTACMYFLQSLENRYASDPQITALYPRAIYWLPD